MKKFHVHFVVPVYVRVEVDAQDREEAKEIATDYVYLDAYCGNGGTNKIIGTDEECVSISTSDEFLEGNDYHFYVEVEELVEDEL